MGKKNTLFLVVCVLVAGTYFGYRYLYKDHRNIQAEATSVVVSANELVELFQSNATPTILNKTVIVHGTISEMDTHSITLDDSVHCVLLEANTSAKVGASIRIKGRCIGYDDLFELVKLDQCQPIAIP